MAADLALARRLIIAEGGLAVVATTRADGTVHASVVSAGIIDDPVTGRPSVGLVVGAGARKLEHFRRSGQASVVFRSGWEWVAVEGPVLIAGPDDLPEGFTPELLPQLLRDVFTAATGTHDDWPEYDRVMVAERRSVVLIEPARIISN